MRIQSLNVSKAKTIIHKGEEVQTGIYKEPTTKALKAGKLGIEDDEQADLVLHGGVDKAVYAFPSEHYPYYQKLLRHGPYSPGQFGENLTTEGLFEHDTRIGDRFQIGDVLLEVSQPRSPCYKFAIKMDSVEAMSVCINSSKTGFYLRVLEDGVIQSGDRVEIEYTNASGPTVEEIHTLYYLDNNNLDGMTKAVRCKSLAKVFRDSFENRIRHLPSKHSA